MGSCPVSPRYTSSTKLKAIKAIKGTGYFYTQISPFLKYIFYITT